MGSEYDFIVVGSGAGGGPLAARLARDPGGYRVALIEAGIDPAENPGSPTFYNYSIPGLHANATEDPETSWEFYVQHYSSKQRQNSRFDRKYDDANNGVFYPRAAALGGCTAHHAMISVYPNDQDWEDIRRITGCDSWRKKKMREIFQRLENCQYLQVLKPTSTDDVTCPSDVPGHGACGWLPVSFPDPTLALRDNLLKSVLISALGVDVLGNIPPLVILKLIKQITSVPRASSGIEDVLRRVFFALDPNGLLKDANRIGAFNTPCSILHGVRSGVREFILETKASYPDRLDLITGAFVTRIIIEDDPLRAVGVRYVKGRGVYGATPEGMRTAPPDDVHEMRIRRGGEVILAGGAFNTPQMLMLSGIGDASHLEDKEVVPKLNLPGVGKNLQDRYEMTLVTEFDERFTLLDKVTFQTPQVDPKTHRIAPDDAGFAEWCNHRGVYAINGVALSFILRSKQVTDGAPDYGIPDLYVFGVPGNFRGYAKGWSKQTEADQNAEHRQFTWAVLKARTKGAAGYVRLRTNYAFDRPEINLRQYDDVSGKDDWKKDRDAVVEGIQFAAKIMESTRKNYRVVYPLDRETLKNQDALKDIVLRESWGHHACGTCKIGNDQDPDAVLDGDFRVRGVRDLRVVDASVFPNIPGFFIVVPIYMISEKAADVILQDARLKRANQQTKPWPEAASAR